ncbi:phospholipase D-like domain-containing protein [Gammaproteobacteria bacterium]|nr:phospholipase D-like domain-containing protein [Gammaproteobacteria bacterium]
MTVLFDKFFKSGIEDQLSGDNVKSIIFFTAFIKSEPIHWLSQMVPEDCAVSIIARFQPNDLNVGASDLEVYKKCSELGWQFGFIKNLHSKIYIFNEDVALLGSANFTASGLNLDGYGNIEMGTEVKLSDEDRATIKSLYSQVTWMNNEMYEQMKKELDAHQIIESKPKPFSWSDELKDIIKPPAEGLWTKDLFYTKLGEVSDPDEDYSHDKDLIGKSILQLDHHSPSISVFGTDLIWELQKSDQELIDITAFHTSKMHKWFINVLMERLAENKYTNFGWLSSRLHNALLDDPPPHRGGVKEFIQNFETWLKEYSYIEFTQYEKTHSYNFKSFYSWTIISDKHAVKEVDPSCFDSSSSGIPQALHHFFSAGNPSGLQAEAHFKIVANKGLTFNFEVLKNAGRDLSLKFQWNVDFTDFLKNQIPNWSKIKPGEKNSNIFMHFKRLSGENTYQVSITKDSLLGS